MKKITILLSIVLCVFAFSSCDIEDNYPAEVTVNSDFEFDLNDWSSFFSGYYVGDELFFELNFAQKPLPAPLDQTKSGLKVSGNNKNKNLMLGIYREISDLKPNTDYLVTFDVDIASNASTINDPALGNPSLMLGVGGFYEKPEKYEEDGVYIDINFPSLLKNGQSTDVLLAIGRIGVNSTEDTFKLLNLNNINDPILLETDSDGRLWLLVCIDSIYGYITEVYYDKINVLLVKQ